MGQLPTLHVYLDEAGNLGFTTKGTEHYVFAAAWTYDPAPLAEDLTQLRFSLLKQGQDLHSFHASEDKQKHRDAVVSAMVQRSEWQFCSVVIQKRRVNPSIRAEHCFYPKFAGMVLRFMADSTGRCNGFG